MLEFWSSENHHNYEKNTQTHTYMYTYTNTHTHTHVSKDIWTGHAVRDAEAWRWGKCIWELCQSLRHTAPLTHDSHSRTCNIATAVYSTVSLGTHSTTFTTDNAEKMHCHCGHRSLPTKHTPTQGELPALHTKKTKTQKTTGYRSHPSTNRLVTCSHHTTHVGEHRYLSSACTQKMSYL